MSALTASTQFVPAAGETVTIAVGPSGGVFNLPAVDANNTALAITNAGPAPWRLNFGTGASLPADAAMRGLFDVPAGATVLVDGALGAVAGTATLVAVVAPQGAANLVIQRGTIATIWTTPAPAAVL